MKNIIIVILAIFFVVLILLSLMKNHFTFFEGNTNPTPVGQMSPGDALRIANSPEFLDMLPTIRQILDLEGTVEDSNILQMLNNLNIPNPAIVSLLSRNYEGSPNPIPDKQMIAEIRETIKKNLLDITEQNLILWYPMNTMTGNTLVNMARLTSDNPDHNGIWMGNSNAIDTNQPIVEGGSLRFENNGIANCADPKYKNYIQIKKIPSIYNSDNQFNGFTVSVWIKSLSAGWWPRIIDFASGLYINHNLIITNSINGSGNIGMFTTATGDWQKVNAITTLKPINDNKWYHVVCTISDTGFFNVYLNGEKTNTNYLGSINIIKNADGSKHIDTKSIVWNNNPGNQAVPQNVDRVSNFIGKSNFWWDQVYNGWMSDFRMYNTELTPTIIKTLHEMGNVLDFNPAIIANPSKSPIKVNNNPIVFPPPSYAFLGIAQDTLQIKNKYILTGWMDLTPNKCNITSSDENVTYCSKNKCANVPPGSWLNINTKYINQVKQPWTIAFLYKVNNMNPPSGKVNFLCGSPESSGGLEAYFQNNGLWIRSLTNIKGQEYHPGVFVQLNGLDTTKPNLFIISVDNDLNMNLSINGTLRSSNKLTQPIYLPTRLCRTIDAVYPEQKHTSSDDMDIYAVVAYNGIFNTISQQYLEYALCNIFGVVGNLPDNHPGRNGFKI